MKIEVEMMKKNGGFSRKNTVSLWERWTDKTMNSKKCSRENWKVLKTVLKGQNTHFLRLNQVADKSPNQAAKHLWDKILKKMSKCFSLLEGPPMRKLQREPWKLLYNLATKASSREQVAKLSCENAKHLDLWNFSKYFSRLKPWPTREPRKPTK